MYWQYGTSRLTTPTIGAYTIETDHDVQLTLVTEAGEDLTDAYLFTAMPEFGGLIQAKLSTGSTYQNIMGPFDATCFLGYIAELTETAIDFRIAFPSGTDDGYRIIPVMVGHDDGAEPPNPLFEDDWTALWLDDWTELWAEDW